MPETTHPHRWRRIWPLIAAATLLVGLALSIGAALLRRSTIHVQEREGFRATAADVSATIAVGLRSDTDFMGILRALVAMQPHLNATQFDRWYSQLDGSKSQVGSLATAVVSVVPAAELPAFQAQRAADPAFRKVARDGVTITPPGRRGRYCLLSAVVSRLAESPLVQLAAHADWCAPRGGIPGTAQVLRSESENGQLSVSPPVLGTSFVGTAVYRRGALLRTVAQRRRATIGWIWSSLDIPAVIRAAIGAHPGFSVALYHRDPLHGMQLIGSGGSTRTGDALAYGAKLDIGGTWAVRVRGASHLRGVSADVQGLLVFGAGALISALLVTLGSMLMRSRNRALGLVDERTGQLRHQELHDALTGLPNRVLALDRAENMFAQARRQRATLTAFYIDLDAFNYVNDEFGQAGGDRVLKLVAARLSSVLGEADTLARLGGDEFLILREDSSLEAGPELMAERLLEVLSLPYEIEGESPRIQGESPRKLSLTACIGVAHGLRDSAEELLRDAGVALGEAKALGQNRCMVFESSMHTAKDRLALKADLADALDRGELSLRYQPVFDLRSQRLTDVEALLRWHHPGRGLIGPEEFIPIAEESGLIEPIGRWVLNEACRQAAAWRAKGHRIGMCVNVSARQLESEALVGETEHALREAGLEARALTLEVTETWIMRDAQANARRLELLKQLGVRIAIDDFGTGHSSLAYLRQFPVDILKIDRSFITGIAQSRDSAAMIHILVQLGKTLGLTTIAEGIKDRAQLNVLLREGCDYGQGFFFMRPLAPEALEELLDGDPPKREPALQLGLDR
jgi:diguanylate cyclase (GGDEF)-like protein